MKLEITFKSGAQVTVDASEFTSKRNQLSGDLTELNWVTPQDWKRKLNSIDLSQVACLVAVDGV